MIYIQGPNGLQPISSQLTKENIIAALGYTPADNLMFCEDESGSLIIADEQGYIIARIDENGLTTTQISAKTIVLDGEDLAAKLQELANKVPNIDLSNYYTKDEVDNALSNIDIPEVSLEGLASEEALNAHANNKEIHVTAEQTASWNAKSNFDGDFHSLLNAPHIVNDNEDEVVICDSQGNVILRATAEGLNVAGIYVNGKSMNNAWKFSVNSKEYEVTPETQRWSDWINANPGKGLVMSGETVYYDYVTDQWLIDVKSSDLIIPGHKYTYNTNY